MVPWNVNKHFPWHVYQANVHLVYDDICDLYNTNIIVFDKKSPVILSDIVALGRLPFIRDWCPFVQIGIYQQIRLIN